MTALVLRTRRLVLRSPVAADAERIRALAGNWNVARMLARMPHPYTIEHVHEYLADVKAAAETGDAIQLAIVLDGGFIGGIGIGPRDGKRTFGYWLGEPYWNQGYTREAAIEIVRHFFSSRPDALLSSAYRDDNVASRKLQERLGFEVVERVMLHSVADDAAAPGVDTRLTRERYLALKP